jgi:hypothetical protein
MEERVLHWPLPPEHRLAPRLRWWPGSMLAAFVILTVSFFVLIEFQLVRREPGGEGGCVLDYRAWGWSPNRGQEEELRHLARLGAPVFFPIRAVGPLCAAPPYVP